MGFYPKFVFFIKSDAGKIKPGNHSCERDSD